MRAREVDLLLTLLLSCALRATGTAGADADRERAEADRLWAARAEPGNLDAAMDLWLAELAEDPEDPEILARLARGEWTRGQLATGDRGPGEGGVPGDGGGVDDGDGAEVGGVSGGPADVADDGGPGVGGVAGGGADVAAAIPHFETGQDYGWRCLLGWPAFAVTIDAVGYRVTPEAVAALPDEAASCLLWTVANGLSLVAARGPGAALELGGVGVLLGRLREIEAPAVEPGFVPWAEARLLVLGAPPDPPPAEARALFRAAIRAAPDVRLFRRDYAAAFPDAADVALRGFSPPRPDPWGLENAAWAGE